MTTKPTTIMLLFTVCLAFFFAFSCESNESERANELARYQGFWQNHNGLYYLDLSDKRPIAFVLEHKAATLSKRAYFKLLDDETLQLVDPLSDLHFNLKIFGKPSSSGDDRCMDIEDTVLCLASRE